MDEKIPLKERIKKEKEKFSKFDAATKKKYFLDYYLIPCILIIAVIVFVCWFVFDFFSSKKTVYSGATVGFLISDDGYQYLTSDFMDSLGSGYKKKKVELSRDTVMTTYDEAQNDKMTMEMAFTSQITAGMFQYAIFTKSGFDHYAGYEFYMPLDEYSSSEKYSSMQFIRSSDNQISGILLSEEVKNKIGYAGDEELVFTLLYTDEHKDLNTPFIDYLFLGG